MRAKKFSEVLVVIDRIFDCQTSFTLDQFELLIDIKHFRIVPDPSCFERLVRACAKTGDATRARFLFSLANGNFVRS